MLASELRDWGSANDPLYQTHPKLAEFLFKKTWNRINPRECGVVTLTVRPTGITVSLKLPSEAQSVSVLVTHSSQLWDALEHALNYGSGDWKELKNGPGAQKLREERKKMVEIEKNRKYDIRKGGGKTDRG